MLEAILQCMLVLSIGGVLLLAAYVLYNLADILLIWFDRRLNPTVREPEPVRRVTIQGSPYLLQGDNILDVGRGVRLSLSNGLADSPNPDMLTWEGKRRVIASSPPVSMSVRVIQDALGAGDGGPALPMMQQGQGSGWLPALSEWSEDDE